MIDVLKEETVLELIYAVYLCEKAQEFANEESKDLIETVPSLSQIIPVTVVTSIETFVLI